MAPDLIAESMLIRGEGAWNQGALLNAKELLSSQDSFFVLNGDILTRLDPNRLNIANSNTLRLFLYAANLDWSNLMRIQKSVDLLKSQKYLTGGLMLAYIALLKKFLDTCLKKATLRLLLCKR